jgi:hypothetical protein
LAHEPEDPLPTDHEAPKGESGADLPITLPVENARGEDGLDPVTISASLHRSSSLAFRAAQSAPAAPGPPRTHSSAVRGRHDRSASADSDAASQGLPFLSPLEPFPLVREAPFCNEVLGELQPHGQLANLGARQGQLALPGIAPVS